MKAFDEDIYYSPRLRRYEKRVKDSELLETVEEVFDIFTVRSLYELMRKRVLKRLNGCISAGKEARVYLGYGYRGERYAVKIYLTATAEFRRGILKYIMGDPRFDGILPKDTRKLIYLWTRKEYRNLKRLYEAGVSVPKPIAFNNNVLVMEFIGYGDIRAPLLVEVWRELDSEELYSIYRQVIENVEKMYCNAHMVHADLSEYNIMLRGDMSIVLIDVSQAVLLDHPNAMDFLVRDIRNIHRFFHIEAGLDIPEPKEIIEEVTSCGED